MPLLLGFGPIQMPSPHPYILSGVQVNAALVPGSQSLHRKPSQCQDHNQLQAHWSCTSVPAASPSAEPGQGPGMLPACVAHSHPPKTPSLPNAPLSAASHLIRDYFHPTQQLPAHSAHAHSKPTAKSTPAMASAAPPRPGRKITEEL